MDNVYGIALKKLLSEGVDPRYAINQLAHFLKHGARTRDIVPALKAARSMVQSEINVASIVVTEALPNSISDERVRNRVQAPAATPIIRKLDPTLSAGWIITYQSIRVDASAKHQLHTWYHTARTRI